MISKQLNITAHFLALLRRPYSFYKSFPIRSADALLGEESVQARNRKVYTEQIRIVYKSLLLIAGGFAVGVTALVASYWGAVNTFALLGWATFMYLSAFVLAALEIAYKLRAPSEEKLHIWAKYNVAARLLLGVSTGAGGVILFISGSVVYQILLIILLCTIVTGSIRLLSVYLPVFYALVVPMLPPLMIRLAVEGTAIHIGGAFLVLAIWLSALNHAKKSNSQQIESILLRLEKADLVQQLKTKQNILLNQKEQLASQKEDLVHVANELALQKGIAEKANVAKSKFIAAASHDLRQPMHALGLFVAILQERVKTEDTRELINNIAMSIEAMEHLFEALLDLSKLDAGAVQPKLEDFNIQHVLNRLAIDFGPQAQEKGISLRVISSGAVARSDMGLLSRILSNLVSNAIRYTEKKGVVVGCRRHGNYLSLEVWDTGIGIPEDYSKDIFEEFFQVDNKQRDRSKGLGLGLAIVKRLAQLLDHPVCMYSRVGRGSVFKIKVPTGNNALNKAMLNKVDTATNTFKPLILIIDDDIAILNATTLLLKEWGYRTIAASSNEKAIEILKQQRRAPDLIISDYRLVAGGLDIIVMAREQFHLNIPAIIITGNTTPSLIQETLRLGYQILHKPVSAGKLYLSLMQIFRPYRAQDLTD